MGSASVFSGGTNVNREDRFPSLRVTGKKKKKNVRAVTVSE